VGRPSVVYGYDGVDRDLTATYQVRVDPTYKGRLLRNFVMANGAEAAVVLRLEMNAGAVM